MTGYDELDPNAAPDWQDQIRRQILSQQGAEPQVEPTPAAEPSTTSPEFAAAPSPTYATSYGDGTTSPDQTAYPQDWPMPAGTSMAPNTNVPAPGNDANQIQGWAQKFLGRNFSDADLAKYFTGHPLDVVMHDIANSPEAMTYAKANGFGQPNAGAANPAAPGAAGAGGLTGGYATVPTGDQAWRDSIRQIIMSRLRADQGPVDENSPEIRAALSASRDAYARQNTQERDALAERLYAQGGGLNTDAVTQQIQQSNERTGTAQGSLKATLLMAAYKDKFTELNHLLDLATQTGNTEQAQQIQVMLANLQAAVQREGLSLNAAEFGATLNQNAALAGLN